MGDVAQGSRSLFALRLGRRRQLEEAIRRRQESFPKERPPDLEHQVVVFLEA